MITAKEIATKAIEAYHAGRLASVVAEKHEVNPGSMECLYRYGAAALSDAGIPPILAENDIRCAVGCGLPREIIDSLNGDQMCSAVDTLYGKFGIAGDSQDVVSYMQQIHDGVLSSDPVFDMSHDDIIKFARRAGVIGKRAGKFKATNEVLLKILEYVAAGGR